MHLACLSGANHRLYGKSLMTDAISTTPYPVPTVHASERELFHAIRRRAITLLLAVAWGVPALAAQPFWYLKNLDSPFVPTNLATVDAMLRVANVSASDYVIDLGSGDGRILIAAARQYGARGMGVDLDPQLVRESLENARMAGVSDRVTFQQRDLFDTDIRKASVVTLYLLPEVNFKLRPRLLAELRPGTRVVSHGFGLGEWQPDLKLSVRGTGSEVFFWVVPAQIAGSWRARVDAADVAPQLDIEFTQKFQEVEATARRDGKLAHIRDVRLDGDRLSFVLIDDADHFHRQYFEGRVKGGVVEGIVRGGGSAARKELQWRAVRAKPET
jgi:SAM-dependent methyltransferase